MTSLRKSLTCYKLFECHSRIIFVAFVQWSSTIYDDDDNNADDGDVNDEKLMSKTEHVVVVMSR